MGDRVDDHRVCVTQWRTWQHPQPPQHVQNFVLRLFEESSGTREGSTGLRHDGQDAAIARDPG